MSDKDTVYRRDAIDAIHGVIIDFFDICDDDEESPMTYKDEQLLEINKAISSRIKQLPSAQPEQEKYEYHYDHTDCIWYRPEARNRCPTTCAQYRDGWNDAMNYIFRDGKGYRPYRRDKQYGE